MDKTTEQMPEVGENLFWRVSAVYGSTNHVDVSLWHRKKRRFSDKLTKVEDSVRCFHWDIAKTAIDIWTQRGEYFASMDRRDTKLGDYPPKVMT